MEKKRFFIATLLVAAAVSVAVVSCKKETQNVLSNNAPQSVKAFTPPQVDDMNAYLKEFKQKMKSADKGDDETLSLEEAAWHLSSVANYDFGHVNVESNAIRFDTIYIQVQVCDLKVCLCDLNTAYEKIQNEIIGFRGNLHFGNPHFRFIDVDISIDGRVRIIITTTFNDYDKDWSNNKWYFPNTFAYADSICDIYFDYQQTYLWNTEAVTLLISAMNGVWDYDFPVEERVFCTFSRTLTPDFLDYIDPYGSPFGHNSRIFNTQSNNTRLDFDNMCYALDSYLGKGLELANSNEVVLGWGLTTGRRYLSGDHLSTWYHIPSFKYGIPSTTIDPIHD